MTLARKLWIYQAERFPLGKTALLVAIYAAGSLGLVQVLAKTSSGPFAYLSAFLCAMILFFQLRAADEVKDLEEDRAHRPERPIPRGLVSLRLILGLAGLAALPALLLAGLSGSASVLCLLATWAWLGLMSVEFFAPAWLKTRPGLYLISHMLIMPMIALLMTSFGWAGQGISPSSLAPFLGLAFANGALLEIGRKTWAVEAERDGVETYSRAWGPARAANTWSLSLLAAAILLGIAGSQAGLGRHAWMLAGLGAMGGLLVARAYIANPGPGQQKRLETASGLWTLLSYGLLATAPTWT